MKRIDIEFEDVPYENEFLDSYDFLVTDLAAQRVRFRDADGEPFGPEMSFEDASRVNAVLKAMRFDARQICDLPRNNDEGSMMDAWLDDLDAVEKAAGLVVRSLGW